jgi:multiple sugar transport system permease protein
LFIFIYRQFFKGLPNEIEEAAFIDGAGAFRTFFKVMLPNAKSSIIIVLLFAFVWQYNDTFFAGVPMSGQGLLAMRIDGLQSLLSQVQFIKDPNQIALIINSGVVLVIVPLIVLYLFMQRYFMEGIERSGIVG